MPTTTSASHAPGFDPGAQHLPWWRRALRQGLGYFAPSTLFVLIPAFYSFDDPLPTRIATSVAAFVTAVLFVGSTLIMHWPERDRWLWLGALITAIAVPGILSPGSPGSTYFGVFVTAAAAVLIPWRRSRAVVVAVTVSMLVVALLQRDAFGVVMSTMAFAVGLSIGLGLEAQRTRRALRAAEERTAVLAVAAERERIGRDLHDILGHSLTAIAVRADLAGRLVGRDDIAARAEVEGLATIARQALSDVRATASAMREVRLATEIASARSVLTAAGVEAVTPSAVPALDDTVSELAGYVVREAVTNVVRHAEASVCTITCDSGGVTISDNGRGLAAGTPGSGSGLAGLRARIERAGGTLRVESSSAGTEVTARWENAG